MSSALTLLAIGAAAAVSAMAVLWASDTRNRTRAVAAAVRPALVAALAVLYAVRAEQGALGRRVAIASMMGSWGARLAVHLLYERAMRGAEKGRRQSASLVEFLTGGAAALLLSLPAFVSSINPEPDFSAIEYVGAALWVAGFAGASTADRQRIAFAGKSENEAHTGRIGLWRLSPRINEAFEALMWIAFALFASGSPWGWIAFACPAAVLYRLVRPSAASACQPDPLDA